MYSAVNSQIKIKVNMFGEFSISINKHTIKNLTGNTKRVWMLIQYLIATRFKPISTEKLIKTIWPDEGCKDPVNALKNLVYRARKILKNLSINKNAEYIQYINNSYRWNNNYHCIVDIEQFTKYIKRGSDISKSNSVRINAYKNAFKIYKGKFLPKSSYSNWVILLNSDYEKKYIDAVLDSCELLFSTNHNIDAIKVCKNAINYFPLEENIHKMLLFSYIYNGQRNNALDHYNFVIKLFYKELGIDISESLETVYNQLTSNIQIMEIDLNTIKKDLKEASNIVGPYFCNYEVFKSIYRIHSRLLERTGNVIFLVLFTVCSTNSSASNPEDIDTAIDKLKATIMGNLRKGDVVTSYNSAQYIIMLPMITFENAEKVTKRILKKFHFMYRRDNIKIKTRISELT